jgi:hypothetical protein
MKRSLNWKTLIAFSMAVSVIASAQTQPPSTGTVHIYRYKLSVGQAAHPTVSCDAFPVARIQNGRVYTMKVSAGRHIFATADNPTGIEVDVKPGKEYFVRIDYPPNASFAVRASPVLVAAEQGRKEISKIRPLDGWFVENAACGRP